MDKTCHTKDIQANLSEVETERATHANRVYCEACQESGVKNCSWETSPAWQEYVEGKIGESELSDRAKKELQGVSDTFMKYTKLEKGLDGSQVREEAILRERAKQANKIYRRVCAESGENNCFFNQFATWSDFVKGNIDEKELDSRAREEIEKMRNSV